MTTFDEEATTIDKKTWGDGPWQDEPDRALWRHRGLPCIITRQPQSGHLCGYVGVPLGHPWHGKGYDDVDATVHGGLTYARACEGDVCHVPKPGESDDVWWLGFDCSHYRDYAPGRAAMMRELSRKHPELLPPRDRNEDETYMDIDYVQAEVQRLANQARVAQGWRK